MKRSSPDAGRSSPSNRASTLIPPQKQQRKAPEVPAPAFRRLAAFVRDRHEDVREFMKLLHKAPASLGWGRRLHIHLRRRARAHHRFTNIHRYAAKRRRRKRRAAAAEAAVKVADHDTNRDPQAAQTPGDSRNSTKTLPQRVKNDIARSPLLLWHTKRMRMRALWNEKTATPCPWSRFDRSARSFVRRMKRGAMIHDRSFSLNLVELEDDGQGSLDKALVVFKHAQFLITLRKWNRRAELELPNHGPVTVWWRDEKRLWIWVHKAMECDGLFSEFRERNVGVRVRKHGVCGFELVGARMWNVLSHALGPRVCEAPGVWTSVLDFMGQKPSQLPPGAVLPFKLDLPRGQPCSSSGSRHLRGSGSVTTRTADAHEKKKKRDDMQKQWPTWMKQWPDWRKWEPCPTAPTASIPVIQKEGEQSHNKRPSTVDEKKTWTCRGWIMFSSITKPHLMAPFLSCDVFLDDDDDLDASTSSSDARTDMMVNKNACIRDLWLRFLHRSGRGGGAALPLGIGDRHQTRTHFGLPDFPMDYPDTRAGKAWATEQGAREREQYARRPKGKRVNTERWALAEPFTTAVSSSSSYFAKKVRPLVRIKLVALRRVPSAGSHIYRCTQEDVDEMKKKEKYFKSQRDIKSDNCHTQYVTRYGRSRMGAAASAGDMTQCRLQQAYKQKAMRDLLGIVTSGTQSEVCGRGIALGYVTESLRDVLEEQKGWELGSSSASGLVGNGWAVVWFRSRTSPYYHPACVKIV